MKLTLPETTLLAALLVPCAIYSQTYQVGDTVEDYSFTNYRTGGETTLYELGEDGGVLVLEWFAWWCPFCANSAANVETGIVEYYQQRGGNPHGVPVRHIAINVQGGARSQSDTFIDNYNFGTVLEDYDRAWFYQFSASGGQPLFAIINAEAGSPTAARWELLYTRLNYFTNEAPDISALMRPVIDSIEPGRAATTLTDLFPDATELEPGWFTSPWFGLFSGSDFPWIAHPDLGFVMAEAGPEGSLLLHRPGTGWLQTDAGTYPLLYQHGQQRWLYLQSGAKGGLLAYSGGEWIPAGN